MCSWNSSRDASGVMPTIGRRSSAGWLPSARSTAETPAVSREVGPGSLEARPPVAPMPPGRSTRGMQGVLRSAMANLPPRRAQVFALRLFRGDDLRPDCRALEIEPARSE